MRVLPGVALALALLALQAGDLEAAWRTPAFGERGMVVSPQTDATRAGVAILRAGGNAIDAAVAVAFALSVTDPYHSGIGGGGFVLIRLADGRVVAIDARETAPAAATRDMYVKKGVPERASLVGALAVGTPGLVKGLAEALAQFGTLPLAEVLKPAIRLAENGFAVGRRHARALQAWRRFGALERFPNTAAIQLPPEEGTAVVAGWRLVQADLGKTLRAIAERGPDVFYRGEIAAAIADEVKRRGGILGRGDLAGYETRRREPIAGSYRGYAVYSFPPPSSGGVALVEILNVLEGVELAPLGAGSSASLHVIAEAMKLAFADRAAFLGDPDFVDVPLAQLVSKQYAKGLRARLDAGAAIQVAGPGLAPPDDAGTTHFSVADAAGNAVAVTQTINTLFGSGITVPGWGIVLNNEMDDFSIALNTPNAYQLVDTSGANAVAPRKRPLSSMTPSILVKDGKLFMVTGSPGGPRIISTTLLTILNVIDFEKDVQAAVSAPRFHHQWRPDVVYVEPDTPLDVIEGLRRRGHSVEVGRRNWSSAQAIVIDPESGRMSGGSDPRGDGLALGY